MYPKWHILLGIVFTLLIWYLVPQIQLIYLGLMFLSSFLIDFDHYVCAVKKTGKLSLRNAFDYHKKLLLKQKKEIATGVRKKFCDFHLFHTIEFHVLVGLLSFIWIGFFYVFVGMIFHSLLDIVSMTYEGSLHAREYFFFSWLKKEN